MNEQFYTIKEFAALLLVHPTTIRRGIKCGRIQALRVGQGAKSTYRILKTEVERMMSFDVTQIIEKRAQELSRKIK